MAFPARTSSIPSNSTPDLIVTKTEIIQDTILLMRRPFSVVGMPLGKTSALIRHPDGRCLLHSAADFGPDDLAQIREWGEVGWLLEVTCMHDTFVRGAREQFPGIPYGLPAGFPIKADKLAPTWRLPKVPAEWEGLLEVWPIRGIPRLHEYAVLHRPSKTLILGDLIFNLPLERPPLMLRLISGIKVFPGTSRLLKMMVKDRAALKESLENLLDQDFERVVVSHGETLASDPKAALRQALSWALDAS